MTVSVTNGNWLEEKFTQGELESHIQENNKQCDNPNERQWFKNEGWWEVRE